MKKGWEQRSIPIENYLPGMFSSAVRNAAEYWENTINRNFPVRNKRKNSCSQPRKSIVICSGNPNALGTTRLIGNKGRITGAKIRMPLSGWTSTKMFEEVLAHEIGHALGLNHNSDISSLMYPDYVVPGIVFPDIISSDKLVLEKLGYKVRR